MSLLKYVRGSVWWYEFTDKCTDTRVLLGKHPCIIISNDFINVKRGIVTVLPITSKISDFTDAYGVEISSIKGDKDASYVMCNQIKTVDVRDLYGFEGIIDENGLINIENKLKYVLGLDISHDLECSDDEIEENFVVEEVLETKNKPETVIFWAEKAVEEPKIKEKSEKIRWDGSMKRQFLIDYEKMKVDKVVEKYHLSNIKAARQKAYIFRKEVGNTKKYKKMVGA